MIHVHGDIKGGTKMGNKNYHKYSENYNNSATKAAEKLGEEINNAIQTGMDNENENPVVNENENPVVNEDPIQPGDAKLTGVVCNCSRLNVRKEASKEADVLCIIDKNEEVEILESTSTYSINNLVDLFIKIRTASGVEGYCVKEYIKIK